MRLYYKPCLITSVSRCLIDTIWICPFAHNTHAPCKISYKFCQRRLFVTRLYVWHEAMGKGVNYWMKAISLSLLKQILHILDKMIQLAGKMIQIFLLRL